MSQVTLQLSLLCTSNNTTTNSFVETATNNVHKRSTCNTSKMMFSLVPYYYNFFTLGGGT